MHWSVNYPREEEHYTDMSLGLERDLNHATINPGGAGLHELGGSETLQLVKMPRNHFYDSGGYVGVDWINPSGLVASRQKSNSILFVSESRVEMITNNSYQSRNRRGLTCVKECLSSSIDDRTVVVIWANREWEDIGTIIMTQVRNTPALGVNQFPQPVGGGLQAVYDIFGDWLVDE